MTFQRVRQSCWLTVVACGLLVAAGCGDGSSAAPSPSGPVVTSEPSRPAPEPTDEPEPVVTDRAGEPLVAPERPAAMDNDDEDGARAAAQYFMAVYGHAVRSQDLTEFNRLCDPESLLCAAVLKLVSADIEAGNVTVGGVMHFEVTQVDPPTDQPFYVVWGKLDRTPFVTYDSDEQPIYESVGDVGTDFAVVVEALGAGEWIVREAEGGVGPTS